MLFNITLVNILKFDSQHLRIDEGLLTQKFNLLRETNSIYNIFSRKIVKYTFTLVI